jgi:hypothetical protein
MKQEDVVKAQTEEAPQKLVGKKREHDNRDLQASSMKRQKLDDDSDSDGLFKEELPPSSKPGADDNASDNS